MIKVIFEGDEDRWYSLPIFDENSALLRKEIIDWDSGVCVEIIDCAERVCFSTQDWNDVALHLSDFDFDKNEKLLAASIAYKRPTSVSQLISRIDTVDQYWILIEGICNERDYGVYLYELDMRYHDIPEAYAKYLDFEKYGADELRFLNGEINNYGLIFVHI